MLQKRQITLGRLHIGPPPAVRSGLEEARTSQAAPCVARDAVDREYSVDRSREFYREIASSYDLRNSANLVATHLETVVTIKAIRTQRSTLRVLDLGGGTGKLIAIYFFNDDAISWTYVDFCPEMAAQFRHNLDGRPLGRNAEVLVEDLNQFLKQGKPGCYDVVLLSLVLSSMPAMPDFSAVARLLHPGGSLIVSDISPGYTRDNPLYKVSVGGELIALRTNQVDPLEVSRRASAAGLSAGDLRPLGPGAMYYSFVATFVQTTAPIADDGTQAAERGRHR